MKNIFKQWSFMRMLRLVFASFLAFEAYRTQQWFFMVFAAFFLFQALFNMGCCGYSNCEIPQKNNDVLK